MNRSEMMAAVRSKDTTPESRYDPERDVLVNYEPNEPNMKPHGFSGAAAWCDRLARTGTVWTASPVLFGVQTSAFMASRLLQIVGAPTIKGIPRTIVSCHNTNAGTIPRVSELSEIQ